jgi:hypothetical protein
MGFEPMIRVLQTLALPLGHVASLSSLVDCLILREGDEIVNLCGVRLFVNIFWFF